MTLKLFEEPGTESLTIKDKLEILSSGNPLTEIMLKIKFHNINYDDLNSNECQILQNGTWRTVNVEHVILLMAAIKIGELDSIIKEYAEYIKPSREKVLMDYIKSEEWYKNIPAVEPNSILKKGITINKIKKSKK